MAKTLKAVERGDITPNDSAGKIKASLAKGIVKFGVVMDDKVIMVEMAWESIRVCSEVQLAELILKYMKDTRDDA